MKDVKTVIGISYENRTTPFSPACIKIMNLFLRYPAIYFTPKTASLSLGMPYDTTKNCMSLLLRNSYLSKHDMDGNTYHITRENMEFWIADFRGHVNLLEQLKDNSTSTNDTAKRIHPNCKSNHTYCKSNHTYCRNISKTNHGMQ